MAKVRKIQYRKLKNKITKLKKIITTQKRNKVIDTFVFKSAVQTLGRLLSEDYYSEK